ncbi:MAG: stress response translation initiation inhibitor YciH [Nanoarchaeota archaeon]|nr:stress response translation initiation inhibitor YciH [Nanoarchaeota archaeon]
MNEVCPKCGLPKELCVCETIAKEAQKIRIRTVKRRYGKITTVVEGIDPKSIDVKDLTKKLKSALACGGTSKDNVIELQGDHKQKVKEILVKFGFAEDQIDVG